MRTETTMSSAGVVVGERAIPFTLPDQEGKPFRLADAIARGPVVVFFYPKDGTPGCTAEACSFRDASEDFAAAGATVVGISSDDAAAHAKFAADHRLGYPILVDEGGRVRAQWKVPRALFGMMDGRVTYVMDTQGVVRHRHVGLLGAKKHVEEALAVVRSVAGRGAAS
jgi:thioredoxin-dependent peroxiredoxin